MNSAVRSALRVAAVATAISAVAVTIAGVILARTGQTGQLGDVDAGLQNTMIRLVKLGTGDAAAIADAVSGSSFQNLGGATTVPQKGVSAIAWVTDLSGTVIGRTPLSPDLPSGDRDITAAQTVDLDGTTYRAEGTAVGGGHLVVATDISATVSGPAVLPLIGIGGGVLVVVFGITFVIGVRAAAPVERSRRAQLEFTANASHELRTPLSVIEAEAALALADPAAEDADAVLGRIAVEGRRLRTIVDGLLWLARRDGEASRPPSSVRDVGAVARGVVARFQPVAVRDGFSLTAEVDRPSASVSAPEDWLERLVAVLLDNACRVTPRGGCIVVTVAGDETQVVLRVDDSGPGIPPAERSRIFERFHRADGAEGGAGLGLSIADAIVRDTRGRWEVGESPHGGARVAVRWPAAPPGSARSSGPLHGVAAPEPASGSPPKASPPTAAGSH